MSVVKSEDKCPECGKKMKIKKKFEIFEYCITKIYKLYQCPICKNVEMSIGIKK